MFDRRTIQEIQSIADEHEINRAALLAVAEVESGGVPFWTIGGRQKPAIRFEGHYFYRNLPESKREQAVQAGLAHPKAGRVKNPRTFAGRYELFERVRKIDEYAAICSFSWGIGQVMGENWEDLGYDSPQELAEACSTISGQVDLMVRFIKYNGLNAFIKLRDWHGFARRYNGKNYRKNKYATKIAAAFTRYSKGVGQALIINTIAAQEKLKALGFYSGPIEGQLDSRTIKAIKDFQEFKGLAVDGIIGPITSEALIASKAAQQAPKAVGGVAAGTAALISGVSAATGESTWFTITGGVTAFAAVALFGIGLVAYLNREHLSSMFFKFRARDQEEG